MRKGVIEAQPDILVDPAAAQDAPSAAAPIDLAFFADFPVAVFALNSAREIVFMNDRCRSLLLREQDEPYGLRPGEAFSCVHASEAPGGCGASRLCRFCGIAKSAAASAMGLATSEECRFERTAGDRIEQLDLLVWSKPLAFGGQRCFLFTVVDISSEKRREIFERLFLHDLMNTATALSSLLRLLDPAEASFDEYLDLAQGAADQLTEEIQAHRALRDAEQGQLAVDREYFSLADAVAAVTLTYRRIAEARGIGFEEAAFPPTAMNSDQVLVKRVLANLLKNAIEACSRGERVTLSCTQEADAVEIRVANPAVLSEDVLANLFKRSFTTKGRGRGLGTYAARLFVEDYLGGSIRCESAEGKGTVFTVRLPC